MKIIINRNEQEIEVENISIVINDVIFRIKVNQFNELVVNKGPYGLSESSMIVKPSVSNEIRLS